VIDSFFPLAESPPETSDDLEDDGPKPGRGHFTLFVKFGKVLKSMEITLTSCIKKGLEIAFAFFFT